MKRHIFVSLSDRQPDALASVFGLDYLLLQSVQPDTRVNHLPHELVLAYEDAAFGVVRGVARMDADAFELRYTEQDG